MGNADGEGSESKGTTTTASSATPEGGGRTKDFIREIVVEDNRTGKHGGRVVTRFPPEPNGYLHIGHAKSICLNFGIAREFGGQCHLRFDDTNPSKEEQEYIDSIIRDVHWLGFDWGEHLYYASNYFEQLYQFAEQLVREGHAYVCDLSADEIRQYRGTLTEPGRDSPYRNRSVEENLNLLRRMRAGDFPDGARVLRAKIDMASPNVNLRDPVLYRILRASHIRTGDAWCIYPMYDFAHPPSDAIEGITHSICTLEFEIHRPLYDWLLQTLRTEYRPQQIEFARLNLTYTVMSKRKLLQLVQQGHVQGWDDPRMPTISGLRRRGYTPESIRAFCERVGVAKRDSNVDMAMLEDTIRDDLNVRAPRVMCVLRPLKLVIDNYPDDQVEEFEMAFHPEQPEKGSRKLPFSKEIYIEQEDFLEDPPKKFFRLSPGREVRLRQAYLITAQRVVKDPQTGEILEVHCTYDPASRGGMPADGRKVKGTLHWVSARHALPATVRLYDRLFTRENPLDEKEGLDFLAYMNPKSLEELPGAKIEPSVAADPAESRYQFERQGFFFLDPVDSKDGRLVYNRTVALRDSYAKTVNKD